MQAPIAVSIQDVARHAGVSPSTVSNVLNNRHERMRPETLHRVRSAIEELGYQPSQAARQLKGGHARIIGLILPSVANPFWGVLAREIERSALSYGYKVMLCNAERNPLHERNYAETMLAQGVRGVILGSSPLSFDHFARLARRGLRIAAFDRQTRTAGSEELIANSVTVDNAHGARLVAEHLASLGHRRVGFISGPLRTASRLERQRGLCQGLAAAGIPLDPALAWEGSTIGSFGDSEGTELGRAGARELLRRPDRPTAIFAMNDMYALGACAGARDLGLKVPQDVSIGGFDDIPFAEVAEPPLTTVRQPLPAMAQIIVTMLVGRLEGTYAETAPHVTAAPELVIRASTAAPSRRSGSNSK
jgi:DNA-binding LacI/PurR family transcriptional regulator